MQNYDKKSQKKKTEQGCAPRKISGSPLGFQAF